MITDTETLYIPPRMAQAATLGITAGHVAVLLHRAKLSLRACMTGAGRGDGRHLARLRHDLDGGAMDIGLEARADDTHFDPVHLRPLVRHEICAGIVGGAQEAG